MRYAHHDRQSPENFLFGDPHDILQPLAYFVWVIVGPHGTFVVDTGFDESMAKKRGRHIVKPIADGLKSIGVQPDAVEDVIVTHLHYDHCGNHDAFPRAPLPPAGHGDRVLHRPVHVPPARCGSRSRSTMWSRWCGRCSPAACVFHDGTEQMAPGITLHQIGGHSKGLQCVRVKTRRGHVVLASDATHLYGHVNEGRVFPVTFSVGDVLEGYSTIKKLADSVDHVIPGHDPAVLERYPAAAPGLEQLVVRLDADPRK